MLKANDFIKELRAALDPKNSYPQKIITDYDARLPFAQDYSDHRAVPAVVVNATTHEDVVAVTKLCHAHQIPLTTRGLGSGTTGAAVPIEDTVLLSIAAMDQIIKMDADNRVLVVQPGVTNLAVQNTAETHGLFWPPDPGSRDKSCVGGNLACNAAGPRALKYGTCRENTLGLKAVIGTGETIRTGCYTTKGVVGYDLTRLLIGSEGTLAIITEATLKLLPLAESVITLQAIYKDIESAAEAVTKIMRQPITPCALEYIDEKAIQLIRGYAHVDIVQDAKALLIIAVDGPRAAMLDARNRMIKACSNAGLLEVKAPESEAEVDAIWKNRRALSPALRTVKPKKINEDVVVPVAQLPQLIRGVETLAQKYQLIIINFGHAGNGNIHVNIMIDPDDKREVSAAKACLDEIFDLVLKLNGTLSGEHGIGLEKRDFITREIDPVSLSLMKNIKRQFDPNNILNPGKIFAE